MQSSIHRSSIACRQSRLCRSGPRRPLEGFPSLSPGRRLAPSFERLHSRSLAGHHLGVRVFKLLVLLGFSHLEEEEGKATVLLIERVLERIQPRIVSASSKLWTCHSTSKPPLFDYRANVLHASSEEGHALGHDWVSPSSMFRIIGIGK